MARVSPGSPSPLASSRQFRVSCPYTPNSNSTVAATARVTCTGKRPLRSAVQVSNTDNAMPNWSVEVIGGGLGSSIAAFESLRSRYFPYPVIGWNKHLETIFAAYYRSLPDVRLRRECLRTKDDGAVALDWVCGDDRVLPGDSPLLILLVCFHRYHNQLYLFI